MRLAPLTPAILVASVALDRLGTDDPVDRMIVATSLAHGARLVTADARMLASRRARSTTAARPPAEPGSEPAARAHQPERDELRAALVAQAQALGVELAPPSR